MKPLLSLFAALSVFTSADAAILEEGTGMLYGSDHAFSFKAPKGWMLDNESGVNQGLHAVFYPKGSSWKDSKVVAYARSRPKTEKIQTPADAAQETIASFRAKGHPKYDGKLVETAKTGQGREVAIYHFTGDKWGNSEAVAYIVEGKTINFLVFNSRVEKDFQDHLAAFQDLAKSYLFVSDQVDIQKGKPAPKVPAADQPKK